MLRKRKRKDLGSRMGSIPEVWRKARQYESKLSIREKYDIFEIDYWALTKKRMKKENKVDDTIIKNLHNKYDLDVNSIIMYTDGSKRIEGKAVGVGSVRTDHETGYNLSIDKECSIFTAEALRISEAL